MAKEKVVGLVLSGGGVRGVAHIGVIQALHEAGIYPHIIAGTSAGALVGAMYAGENSPEEMLHFFQDTSLFQFRNLAFRKPALIDTHKFIDKLTDSLPGKTFEDLSRPLFVTTTDMLHGELKVFSEGELIRPVLASAAFPGMFSPIEIEGSLYSDGGIMNNFPVELIRDRCDLLIGVDVNPIDTIRPKDMDSIVEVLSRSIRLSMRGPDKAKHERCDWLIHPMEICEYDTFAMGKLQEIYDIGYQEAQIQLQNFLS